MRSCLIQLLIAVAVIFALLWFGVPLGASWLATNALNAVGFTGTDTKVEVSADLPPRLLVGHADTVRVRSSQVSVGDLNAATMDVTLGNVELIDRKIGTVDGSFSGVRVPAPNGDPVTIDTVAVKGSGASAKATLTISTAEAERLADSQIKAQTGAEATVRLASSERVSNGVPVTVTISGHSQQGVLEVNDGALELVPVSGALPTVTLIAVGQGNPFELQSVTGGAGTVTLVGTIDLQSLLGL